MACPICSAHDASPSRRQSFLRRGIGARSRRRVVAIGVACLVMGTWVASLFASAWCGGSLVSAHSSRQLQMNAKKSRSRSRSKTGTTPRTTGTRTRTSTSSPKTKQTKPPAPSSEPEGAEVFDPLESDEDREFRERYLSADKETEPDWKQKMDQAKTKEDRFKVGLQVGDFKTSYSILAEELLGSFVDGDKDRLDQFLTKAGIAQWQLLLVQLVVIGVPLAVITYLFGLWTF
ncbi:unnamed protein product [Durusdinium trenchii]|uniref:Uncharacterized protein n=2 Tax=Durusdinium trenchii TaxID=1381693 RepID=A0ABP0HRR5_9DINO